MDKPKQSQAGFTLIELLTVIAIIGILAGFIAVGLPGALERAKIARLENSFLQARTLLTTYYTDHNTYPPGYGYINKDRIGVDPATLIFGNDGPDQLFDTNDDIKGDFVTKPWMTFIKEFRNFKMYDDFSEDGFDTNQDGAINRMEFSPHGALKPGTQDTFLFTNQLYNPDNIPGGSNVEGDLNKQLLPPGTNAQRPLVYIPVNGRQARMFAKAMFARNGRDPRPDDGGTGVLPVLQQLTFPPSSYDEYVIISIGPNGNTRGLLYDFNDFDGTDLLDISAYTPAYRYHILGLVSHFMATRDANNNGDLDFGFRPRTRKDEAEAEDVDGVLVNQLPDVIENVLRAPDAPGPIIFVSP